MRGIGAGTRIFELLGRQPAIPISGGADLDPTRRGPVRFEDIGFQYPSRQMDILKDFSLEIGVGENVAIVYDHRSVYVSYQLMFQAALEVGVEVGNRRSTLCFCDTMILCRAGCVLMDKVNVIFARISCY
jgi:hypothetical protein